MADKVNNIGRLFYKDYYKEVDWVQYNNLNKGEDLKIDATIKDSPLVEIKKPVEGIDSICATVLYPGLVTGVGLSHDAKVGYKLGMHFDYTHGMPIVYGSSVKGVLKTYFKDFFLAKYPNANEKTDAEPLVEMIFEGKKPNKNGNVPLYERDVFFDAVIVKSNDKGKILEDDYITPHPDPLKNPTPIKMLKIASGCTMEFRFRLCDTVVGGMKFSVADKLELFKDILTTVGIGAKTNVGYGQLKIVE